MDSQRVCEEIQSFGNRGRKEEINVYKENNTMSGCT